MLIDFVMMFGIGIKTENQEANIKGDIRSQVMADLGKRRIHVPMGI